MCQDPFCSTLESIQKDPHNVQVGGVPAHEVILVLTYICHLIKFTLAFFIGREPNTPIHYDESDVDSAPVKATFLTHDYLEKIHDLLPNIALPQLPMEPIDGIMMLLLQHKLADLKEVWPSLSHGHECLLPLWVCSLPHSTAIECTWSIRGAALEGACGHRAQI